MQTKVKPIAISNKYNIDIQVNPLTEWEKRKMCGYLSFHMMVVTCVVLILYVLIDRVTEKISSGQLQWTFWIMLGVGVIGVATVLVLTFIHFLQIWKKWKAFNRTIIVQVKTTETHNS